jgi:hypothetical protein
MLLLIFVAVGAILSISTSGTLSAFAGGFAVGAGSAFVFSRMKRPEEETGTGQNEEGS